MYYQSSQPEEPHLVFIGRWHPFHEGHMGIVQEKLSEQPDCPVMILVRDTKKDNDEGATAEIRAGKVVVWMINNQVRGAVVIIPDVFGVYWGRGVGYEVGEVVLPEKLQKISGTAIRKGKTTEELFSDKIR